MHKKISNGLWHILNKVPTVCIEIGIGVLVYALYLKGKYKGITEYDVKAKELTKLKNEYPELWKSSMYYKQFGDDYNGATGFTLWYDLDDHQKEIIRALAGSIMRR